MKKFPTGKYGKQTLTFYAAPFRAPIRAFAALVFPWQADKVLVCNIADRGWCVPSGRVEPFEESMITAQREALEEAGAILDHIQYIGCYLIAERREIRWADVYAASVRELTQISKPEESLDRKFVTIEQLPEDYHLWNELTERVFQYSYEVLVRTHNGLQQSSHT